MREKRTAALHNLGCKVNSYETEAMQQMLEEAGYTIVPFEPGVDVYIINTCSVTNIADRKSRQMMHRAKKMNPNAAVVAVGCYVQTARDKTGLDIDADIILGNNKKKDLVQILDAYFAKRSAVAEDASIEELLDLTHNKEYETLSINRTEEHTRAFIKVQDGCNQFCSYCIIPYARGRVRSRKKEDVLEEIKALSETGIREVVITGIHLSSYGVDLSGEETLLTLLESISQQKCIDRIRLGSLEPRIITEEFAARIAAIPEICPHFHLSLQSGCDSVLKRMNRHYSAAEYKERCEILRKAFDDPAITTDVIVGFPGESAEEFDTTEAFLSDVGLYETHIFKYSKREGTKAAAMPDQISEQTKGERSNRLINLGEKNRLAYEKRHAGKRCEVLFEEEAELFGQKWFTGYTREYIRVLIPADADYTNKIVNGTLTYHPAYQFLTLA